ncbi:Uncharacterised protein [Vibrio cholerae]|nr:Uncharacterised protein [Vibrio cholerae]
MQRITLITLWWMNFITRQREVTETYSPILSLNFSSA